MWVCLCKGVSTSTIRAAITDGAATVKAIGEACGAGTDCMRCQRHLKLLLDETRRPSPAVGSSAPPASRTVTTTPREHT